MRKTILAAAIGALVLGGATVVAAQTDDTVTEATEADGPIAGAVGEVLAGLVADGTLTLAQADAVTDALVARRDEWRAEREAVRDLLEEFWADDELTQAEIDQLPDGHPLRELSELFDDGSISRDEVRDLRPGRGGFGPRWAGH